MPLDSTQRKAALRMLTYGLYVAGIRAADDSLGAFTATWLSQVSFEPPLVVMAANLESGAFKLLRGTGGDAPAFAISILAAGQEDLAKAFFRAPEPKEGSFAGIPFELHETGAPILADAPAFIECAVREIYLPGDHALVIGEVRNALVRRSATPLRLHDTPWKYGG